MNARMLNSRRIARHLSPFCSIFSGAFEVAERAPPCTRPSADISTTGETENLNPDSNQSETPPRYTGARWSSGLEQRTRLL